MSNVPLARKELEAIRIELSNMAEGLDRKRLRTITLTCKKLRDIDELLRRKPPAHKRAKVKCRKVTPEVVIQVKAYKTAHVKHSHFEIAKKFKLNPGRVSEILNHKKDHLLAPLPLMEQIGDLSGRTRQQTG